MDAAISPIVLSQRLAAFPPPTLLDVRRDAAFERDPDVIPGAIRRTPEMIETWAPELEPWRPVVVYCVRGHAVGSEAAAFLRARGFDASHLDGGLAGWRESGGATTPWSPPTRWVTRERPKIDRIACPWLVRRFIDPSARFLYVPADRVTEFAAENNAIPFDVSGAAYGHVGTECSFDAFMRLHRLVEPGLAELAAIVRAADTAMLDAVAQASGLLAASQGLSTIFADDHAMLKWGMLLYDALYAQCRARHFQGEKARREGCPA